MPSALPLLETTKLANVADQNLFIPFFKQVKQTFNLSPKVVLGDSIFDREKILSFVINDLKTVPTSLITTVGNLADP
jgi:hypothetical protein